MGRGELPGNPEIHQQIIHLLLDDQNITRGDIAKRTGLSMPTVLQNVGRLMEAGIVEEAGISESTGGRPAKMLRISRSSGILCGVNVGLYQVTFLLMDVYGNPISERKIPAKFESVEQYYNLRKKEFQQFLWDNEMEAEELLCVGVSFPGIIDQNLHMIRHSHVLGLENVDIDFLYRSNGVPIVIQNDANCNGYTEMKTGPDSYLYLSLNESVGGSIVLDHQMIAGESSQAGEVGHMILYPHGEKCYCGKEGCADSYLSSARLVNPGQRLDIFFDRLQDKDENVLKVWDEYLENLGMFISNLRMMMNIPIIVRGEVGKYLLPYMDELRERTVKYDLFTNVADYVLPCSQREDSEARGAALIALSLFKNRILVQ